MKTPGMKRLGSLLAALAFTAWAGMPAFAETGQLTIKATGFKSDKGQALFAVVDSPEAYDDIGEKAIAKSKQKITAGKAQASFTLPYGWYAVSVVHDQNKNLQLDTNFLGLPQEPYGFSNNPKVVGKPSFAAVKFKLDASPKTMEVMVE